MGGGTFDTHAYHTFTNSTASKPTDGPTGIYSSSSLHKDLNPFGVRVRESRDSPDNPQSTPLIVALDVTGSMGSLADIIAREGLGVLFDATLTRKPITNPHLMFMGVGDANFDHAPLQVSQFEADNRITEQLTKLYLEHGGGGNSFESYNLPWYFAAMHTVHDSMEKRGKRGYLFTVGDERAPGDLTPAQIKRFIGDDVQPMSSKEMLELAQRVYDVFHIVVLEGSHARHDRAGVLDTWGALLGQRVIPLADYRALAETIVSAIEMAEGRDATTATSHWGSKAAVVHDAVKHLPASKRPLLGHP